MNINIETRYFWLILSPLLLLTFASNVYAIDFGFLGKASQAVSASQTGIKAYGSARKGFKDITPEEEYYIGRAVTAQILTRYKLDRKAAQTAYLNQVGGYLLQFSTRPETFNGYHFSLIKSDQINAFAAPGGNIMVTTGLYRLLKNEEQLAAVLAHEIAHVSLQHGLSAIKKSNLTQAFTIIGKAGLDQTQVGGNINQLTNVFNSSIDNIVNELVIKGYSREQELDADAMALGILYLSGYSLTGMEGFLLALDNIKKTKSGTGFLKTHPPADIRLKAVRKKMKSRQIAASSNTLRDKRFAGLSLK